MHPKLETRQLRKEFSNGKTRPIPVLSDISLQIQPSEFVSIVGASGCGKPTFLRLLDG